MDVVRCKRYSSSNTSNSSTCMYTKITAKLPFFSLNYILLCNIDEMEEAEKNVYFYIWFHFTVENTFFSSALLPLNWEKDVEHSSISLFLFFFFFCFVWASSGEKIACVINSRHIFCLKVVQRRRHRALCLLFQLLRLAQSNYILINSAHSLFSAN